MSDLAGQRIILQNEELKSGVPGSEGTMQRIGKSTNFLLEQPMHNLIWSMNGQYSIGGAIQNFVDGPRMLSKNYYIHAIAMWAYTPGSSGDLIIDVVRRPPSGPATSIFSVQPKVNFSSGAYGRLAKRFPDNTTLVATAGTTLPTLSVTNLDAGDFIEMNLLGVQASGFDGGLQIELRPR
jgi:hypothetical protein